MAQITIYADGDKTNPQNLNMRATGDTYRLREEFKARGFSWTGTEWTKSQPATAAKPDADWFLTVADCRVFVGGRLMHTGA